MKCPGQDTLYWKPGAIYEVKCPKCEHMVEFFKDDTARKCGNCGHRFVNPQMDFGCAAYCEYAEQCLGTLPDEVLAQKEDLLKDRVAVEMKRYLKTDFKRIGHATRVARYAERIGKKEMGVMPVILCAAYLYRIGALEALQKYGSADADSLEKEGPPVARSILTGLKAKEELIDAVCAIVGHHQQPEPDASLDFKIVYEADKIAEMEDRLKDETMDAKDVSAYIDEKLLTRTGKEEARKVLLG